jgi:ABC-type amino acid transport substrate-binding protein
MLSSARVFHHARRLAHAALLAAAGFTAGHGAVARPLDEVMASGVLRVAVYGDNTPFSEEGEGAARGIDADIARALAERLKLRLDLRVVDAGENVDGDFRLNLWRGDLAGSPLADLMLHVPHDRVLATRNEQIFLTTPYFEQRLGFAYRRGRIEGLEGVRDLEGHRVAVEGTSASDSLLMNAEGGRYRDAVQHYRSFDEAAKAYLAGETPILAGTRAAIEAAIAAAGAGDDHAVVEVPVPGLVRTRWDLGGAVRSDSRDLAYAVGDALAALAGDGRLKAICATYGVTYTPPQGY